jgi:hypothetical protein
MIAFLLAVTLISGAGLAAQDKKPPEKLVTPTALRSR